MRVIALVLYLRIHYIAVGTNSLIVQMCRKTPNKQTNKSMNPIDVPDLHVMAKIWNTTASHYLCLPLCWYRAISFLVALVSQPRSVENAHPIHLSVDRAIKKTACGTVSVGQQTDEVQPDCLFVQDVLASAVGVELKALKDHVF
jgi:hypothetical protein